MRFAGARIGGELCAAYAAADLLVLPSRAETYGMVVTEALARGVPVIAADVGGVREALGHAEDGTRPGLLVPPDDFVALGEALRSWLDDEVLRARLRRAATTAAGDVAELVADHGRGRGGAGMSVVSPEWLDLREPADAAARSAELADALAEHLPAGPLVIHDLGGGSGSMGRWLAPRLPGPQHWVVHDRDETLLELAVAHPPPGATVEARASDITQADLTGADLVVASALLDILTADELAAVLDAARGRPMLFALTVVGRVMLTPADPLDAAMTAAFNDHQRRRRPARPGRRRGAVDAAGGIVRPSPWRLGADDAGLIAEWLDGWVAAALEQEPALAGRLPRRRRSSSRPAS